MTLFLYHAEIPKLAAQRELRVRRSASDPTEEYIYKLVLLGTGDREQADMARSYLAMSRMRNEA